MHSDAGIHGRRIFQIGQRRHAGNDHELTE
jgi:hypothetical protein